LLGLLPGVRNHHCSKGRPGGFVERLEEGTYFGHIVEHVALELTARVGIGTFHGKTRAAGAPGVFNVVIEYKAETGAEFLMCKAAARDIIARTELGPSTLAIVEAAKRRGIPATRLGGGSLIQLGYGKHRRFIQAAMTSATSAVGVDIASDKELTKACLSADKAADTAARWTGSALKCT
jgi:cyanophycin synthetase